MKKETLAQLAILVAAILWGTTFFVSKAAVSYAHPLTVVSWRFLLAALLFSPFVWKRRTHFKEALKPGVILGFFIWVALITQTWGLKFTTAANSGFITGLFIIFVPIFLFLFKRVLIHRLEGLAIIVALVGLWILTGGVATLNTGDQLTLICAVASAWHLIFMGQYAKATMDKVVLTFIQFVSVGVLSLFSVLLAGAPLIISSLAPLKPILFLAVFGTVCTFSIQVWGQKYVNPVKASLIFALEPVSSACFAWTLGGEKFSTSTALGGILILLATIISTLKR